MAIARFWADTVATSSTTATITLPASIPNGSLGIITACWNMGSVPAVPSGWTSMTPGDFITVTSSMKAVIYYKYTSSADSGLTLTINPTTTTYKKSISGAIYTGVSLEAPLYGTATNTAGFTVANPSVSVSVTSAAVSFCYERSSTPTTVFTPPGTFTLRDSAFTTGGGAVSGAVADNLTTSSSSVGGGGNWTGNQSAGGTIAITVALKDASAPPPEPAYDHFVLRSGGVTTELELVRKSGVTVELLDVVIKEGTPPPTDLVDALTGFTVVAHRGGYDNPASQNTMACFRLGAAQCGVIEMDIQPISDGTLVTWHDDDVDAQAASGETGLVSGKTRTFWNSFMCKASTVGGGGTKAASYWDLDHPTKADENCVVGEFGGTDILLVPESKDSSVDVALRDSIVNNNIQHQCLVQSFGFSSASYFAAQGLHALYLTNSPNAATIAAAGIEFVGVADASITTTIVNNCHAQGLKVWVYTVNSTSRRDTLIGMGVDGVFTNKPYLLA